MDRKGGNGCCNVDDEPVCKAEAYKPVNKSDSRTPFFHATKCAASDATTKTGMCVCRRAKKVIVLLAGVAKGCGSGGGGCDTRGSGGGGGGAGVVLVVGGGGGGKGNFLGDGVAKGAAAAGGGRAIVAVVATMGGGGGKGATKPPPPPPPAEDDEFVDEYDSTDEATAGGGGGGGGGRSIAGGGGRGGRGNDDVPLVVEETGDTGLLFSFKGEEESVSLDCCCSSKVVQSKFAEGGALARLGICGVAWCGGGGGLGDAGVAVDSSLCRSAVN